MSSQKKNEQKETTMQIFTGFLPDGDFYVGTEPPAGGFATNAGEETCECEKNYKNFSQEDLGFKVDDPEFHGPSTDGKNKRLLRDEFDDPIRCESCGKLVVDSSATSGYDHVSFGSSATDGKDKDLHVDHSGMPLCCLYCRKWVVNPAKHYIPDDNDDSQPNQIPRCQIESYTLNMCNRCSYPVLDGSYHTDDLTRPCNPSCYADGTKHFLDEKLSHVDRDGLPVKCGICENWIKNHENHGKIFFPDDDELVSSPFCVPDNSENEMCNNCKFPKIRGSVHHTDPTRPCDPSRYANGEIVFLDKNGCQIQCEGCLNLIGDPREHQYVPYLDTHKWCWSCTQFPEQMMSFASGGF
jgi:ribosomal protein S27E